MKLIYFKHDGATAVLTFLGDDASKEAIDKELSKWGYAGSDWREITHADYAKIVAARPLPVTVPNPEQAPGDMRELLLLMQQMADRIAEQDARLKSLTDDFDAAKVPTFELVEDLP